MERGWLLLACLLGVGCSGSSSLAPTVATESRAPRVQAALPPPRSEPAPVALPARVQPRPLQRQTLQVGPPPLPARLPEDPYPKARPSSTPRFQAARTVGYPPPSVPLPRGGNPGYPIAFSSAMPEILGGGVSQARIQAQNARLISEMQLQQQRTQAQNWALIQARQAQQICRPLPGGPGYPTVSTSGSQSDRAQQLRRQYDQAQADFLNQKYCSHGPPRFTPQSASVSISAVAPPNPVLMQQPAMFNPVLQKYQAAQAIRQELRQVTGSSYP